MEHTDLTDDELLTLVALVKLVVHKVSQRVLGCHMLGEDAPEIIQGFAVAITAGATKHDFDNTVAVHPTSSEEFVLMPEPMAQPA